MPVRGGVAKGGKRACGSARGLPEIAGLPLSPSGTFDRAGESEKMIDKGAARRFSGPAAAVQDRAHDGAEPVPGIPQSPHRSVSEVLVLSHSAPNASWPDLFRPST